MEGMHGAGKGDTYRPVDYQKWSDNWDKIFGKKTKKGKVRNEQSERKEGTNASSRNKSIIGGQGTKGDADRPDKRRTSHRKDQ